MKGTICIALALFAFQVAHGQPVITAQPESRVAAEGRPVSFSIQAQGATPLRYQWQFNGSDLPGKTGRSLSFFATQSRAGTYAVVVRDAAGNARSSAPAQLDVQKRPIILAHPQRQVVGVHQTAVFQVSVNDSGPHGYVQWYHHSTAEPAHPIPPAAARGVNTFRLEVVDASNNDTFNGLYWIVITNDVGRAISRRAQLTVVGPPVIARGPIDRSLRRGGTAFFSIAVARDAAGFKSFQWYFNGEPIAGATRSMLAVRNVQPENQGAYYCAVTSIGGTATSSSARLTVF